MGKLGCWFLKCLGSVCLGFAWTGCGLFRYAYEEGGFKELLKEFYVELIRLRFGVERGVFLIKCFKVFVGWLLFCGFCCSCVIFM